LLAKDSKVRGKPLQLGRTYHRRRTLRKMKTAGKVMENHPDKYMIRMHQKQKKIKWNTHLKTWL